MFEYDKNYISKRASEYGFIRDTLEKVYRLADILEYLNIEPTLKNKLALKGGTAINLTVFDLPRLSAAISSKEINKAFDTVAIDSLTSYKIGTDLLPVLTKRDSFDLETAKEIVKTYISDLMLLAPSEQEFLDRFEAKEYNPELLFDDREIIDRINNHPMALWKVRQ